MIESSSELQPTQKGRDEYVYGLREAVYASPLVQNNLVMEGAKAMVSVYHPFLLKQTHTFFQVQY